MDIIMLIIAQPKSASTSLLDTVSRLAGLKKQQKFYKNPKKSLDLPHSDIMEYKWITLKNFIDSKTTIFKQHIPPTKNNYKIIKKMNKKVVVLLRDPQEAALAYQRHMTAKSNKKTNLINTQEEYYKFWNNLKEYHKWKELDNVLVVHFENLINNPTNSVNEILKFWNFKTVNTIELSKKRYSGKSKKNI